MFHELYNSIPHSDFRVPADYQPLVFSSDISAGARQQHKQTLDAAVCLNELESFDHMRQVWDLLGQSGELSNAEQRILNAKAHELFGYQNVERDVLAIDLARFDDLDDLDPLKRFVSALTLRVSAHGSINNTPVGYYKHFYAEAGLLPDRADQLDGKLFTREGEMSWETVDNIVYLFRGEPE
jgi:hypothetical protein